MGNLTKPTVTKPTLMLLNVQIDYIAKSGTSVLQQCLRFKCAPPILDGGPVVIPPSAVARARFMFEEALRAYNGSKVRTKAHRGYVLGLRNAYITEYKRLFSPPPQYDRPYTGTLRLSAWPIWRHCKCIVLNSKTTPDAPRSRRTDLGARSTSCRTETSTDAQKRKLFGYSYANFLRHELAHCNGWPGDHPH